MKNKTRPKFLAKISSFRTHFPRGMFVVKNYLKYSPHFALEFFLLGILMLTVGTNLSVKASSNRAENQNQSLLFSYLQKHPTLNEKLVDTYQSINIKLTQNHFWPKQILAASIKTPSDNTNSSTGDISLPTLSGSALLKPNPASSTGSPEAKKDVQVYQVQNGDTVGRIALSYGVSVDTILWENNLASAGLIRTGQELRILPTSGVRHIVQSGETISGIAQKYGVDPEDIFEYNGIDIENHIFPGEEIIIPNGVKKAAPTPARQEYLAGLQRDDYERVNVPGNYESPSTGLIWPLPAAGRISQYYSTKHRAIDVPCRDCEVVAAASGIVELSGWQGGYGYNIVLNHGKGLKTRYAHASKLLVSAGEAVEEGQTIMISGSTGRSTGPHLHFEIVQSGTLLNPLNLVSR